MIIWLERFIKISFIAIFVCAIVSTALYIDEDTAKYTKSCELKGGIVVNTASTRMCIKKENVIIVQ